MGPVILRSHKRRRILHCIEKAQGKILRFAQNDISEAFFRSLERSGATEGIPPADLMSFSSENLRLVRIFSPLFMMW